MKITLKTLKGQQLPLEIEPDMKVTDLKAKIAEVHGMPAETQKLIAYGKVMDDGEKTVSDYKIVENGFIVVMAVKAKPVKPPTEEAKQEEVAQPGVTLPAQADQPAQAQAPVPVPAPSQPAPVAQPAPSTSTALPAGIDEDSVSTLVGITGKDRNMCIQALQVTQGNLDMACSLLFEGVSPEQLQQMAAGAGMGGGADDYGNEYGNEDHPGAGQMPGLGGAGGDTDLSELMQNPAWPTIVERLRTNPQFYQEFMQLLQTQNPTVFARIQANPMAFMNLVMGGNPNIGGGAGAGARPGAGAGAGAGQPRAPAPGQIQVTSSELEAIQRLQSLGFSQHQALEAYMVCDKNEEFAANYLFEQAVGDESAAMNNAVAQSMAASQQASNPVAPTEAQAEPQPQPEAQQQPAAEANQEQPAAEQQQQPAADAEMNDGNNAPDNNNNGNGDGDAGAGAGEGGEKSAFE